jgi:hypothetical protein
VRTDTPCNGGSAVERGCDNGAGWGPGSGGDPSPGPSIQSGDSSQSGSGTPGGYFDHIPGTGCHPDSPAFQDRDNWRTARQARLYFQICDATPGASPRVLIKGPQNAGDDWRLTDVECTYDNGVNTTSFPTTLECYNEAWTR